ncbi:retrotransposon protein, putative, ty1-copia subclass [Tanacetum coccineum]
MSHVYITKASGSNVTFLILYVDDILIMGNNIPMLQDVKSYLGRCFAMKDLVEAAYILGIKIYKDRSRRLIEKLRLGKSQGASTPCTLKRIAKVPICLVVDSIMYAVRCTCPDVTFAQNITSRFQQNPELRVSCYTDAGYLTDVDDLKSQTGYVFILNGGVVDWKSKKQKAIFATFIWQKPEYIALIGCSKEAVWESLKVLDIFRAKVHYLREVIEYGDIKLEKVHTYDNLADPFTKALAFPKH